MLVVRMRRGVDRGHYCVEDSGTHGTDRSVEDSDE